MEFREMFWSFVYSGRKNDSHWRMGEKRKGEEEKGNKRKKIAQKERNIRVSCTI